MQRHNHGQSRMGSNLDEESRGPGRVKCKQDNLEKGGSVLCRYSVDILFAGVGEEATAANGFIKTMASCTADVVVWSWI
jgi:hypothetical protein